MTFAKEGDQITLTMTANDYTFLLWSLGANMGYFIDREPEVARAMLHFLNAMNTGNTEFRQYDVEAKILEWVHGGVQ